MHRLDAQACEEVDQAVFHRIGEGSDQQQLTLVSAGQQRTQCCESAILAIGEGGLDPTAGVCLLYTSDAADD